MTKSGKSGINGRLVLYPGFGCLFCGMATQIGLFRITGTVGGICFYQLNGVYYARQKSSLTGERVKRDPAFAETMRQATQMGNASRIASAIYRQTVPQEERSRERFREVVSMVKRELAADGHK